MSLVSSQTCMMLLSQTWCVKHKLENLRATAEEENFPRMSKESWIWDDMRTVKDRISPGIPHHYTLLSLSHFFKSVLTFTKLHRSQSIMGMTNQKLCKNLCLMV